VTASPDRCQSTIFGDFGTSLFLIVVALWCERSLGAGEQPSSLQLVTAAAIVRIGQATTSGANSRPIMSLLRSLSRSKATGTRKRSPANQDDVLNAVATIVLLRTLSRFLWWKLSASLHRAPAIEWLSLLPQVPDVLLETNPCGRNDGKTPKRREAWR
jgi:hypothetical protein